MAKKIIVVSGLLNGDEGKGATVDALTRKYNIRNVVRFHGGPQPAHNVVSPTGIHHTFSQFGSNMMQWDSQTLISRYTLVNPVSLQIEAHVLQENNIGRVMERTFVSAGSPIVTTFHAIINQMREVARGENRHGSCGKGAWETVCDLKALGNQMLFVGDLSDQKLTVKKLDFIWRQKIDLAEQICEENPEYRDELLELLQTLRAIGPSQDSQLLRFYDDFPQLVNVVTEEEILEMIARDGAVFEGGQGALLDADYGFHPYVTSSNTTMVNADDLINQSGFDGEVIRIGVIRGYLTRHGAGPMVTEDKTLLDLIPADHNGRNKWQRDVRLGWLDLVAVKYAISINSRIDFLAVTNLDRMAKIPTVKVAFDYRDRGEQSRLFYRNAFCSIPLIEKQALPQKNENNDLTNALFLVKPVYFSDRLWTGEGVANRSSKSSYTDFISNELGVPIGILSFGPKASDRIFKI